MGLPYAKTAYVYNATHPIHPAAYPPGLPLLLAPVYHVFGVDLMKMKIVCTLILVLFLAIHLSIARKFVPPMFAFAATAAIGLHPFVVDMGNSLGSEYPFLLFCYAALQLVDGLQNRDTVIRWDAAGAVVAAAFAIAFAYQTRSIGVILFPVAAVVSLYYSRRVFTVTTVTLAGAAVIAVAVQLAFPGDVGTYIHNFDQFTLHGLLIAVKRYLSVRTALLGVIARAWPLTGIILGSVVLLLGLIGFWIRARRRVSVFEVFFVTYVLCLLVFPIRVEAARYSMPVWPLLFLYCAAGIDWCCRMLSRTGQYALTSIVCLTVTGLYVAQYASMDFGPIPISVDAAPSRDLLAAISNTLPNDARLLARKPTIIALFTGREATTWPEPYTDDDLRSYMARLRVDYVVQDVIRLSAHSQASDALDCFIQRNRSDLQLIFSNRVFRVYRFSHSHLDAQM